MKSNMLRNPVRWLCATALAMYLFPTSADAATATVPTWSKVSNMTIARDHHTATRLADSRVLIVGGFVYDSARSAEIYDPQNNNWQATSPMNRLRRDHRAMLLANGKVLVVGGLDIAFAGNTWLNTAEIYDPGTDSWTYTSPPIPLTGFGYAPIVRLNDGRIYSASGQIYDPSTDTWTQTAAPAVPSLQTTSATLLNDGRILIVWRFNPTGCWIYDPATDSLTTAAQRNGSDVADNLVLLADGRVMAIGDLNGTSGEIYNPQIDSWQLVPMPSPRSGAIAVLLNDGWVLMVGGGSPGSAARFTADIFNPISNMWSPTADMQWSRNSHTATVLEDGRVLVTGGGNNLDNGAMPTAEVFDEASLATLVEGGRRPSVDAFLSWSGTYLTSVHSTIYGSQPNLNPPGENTIVLFLITGANGETVSPSTAVIKWNDIDVTPAQLPVQGVIPLRLPVTQTKNLILSAVDGIVPGTQRTATDTDRIVLEGTVDVQPFDQP